MWPLALRDPMTGTHGVCISDISRRRSSSLWKKRSRQVTHVSLSGEGVTGSRVVGRTTQVARIHVVPREITGVVQPGWPSVSPDTPARGCHLCLNTAQRGDEFSETDRRPVRKVKSSESRPSQGRASTRFPLWDDTR